MTQPRFSDLAQAAEYLAQALPDDLLAQVDLVIALGESAMPIADVVADTVGTHAVLLPVSRDEEPVIGGVPVCAGRGVLVVDRGVETGRSAMLAGRALRSAGAARLMLAVPVCPRQAEAHLAQVFDKVVAIHRPLARRSLQWHYVAPLE